MRERKSARLLVVSPAGRILLFSFSHDQEALRGTSYWATPGGALEDGETFEAAARRELYEETGIEILSVGLPVGYRDFPMCMPDGERVEAREQYFCVRAQSENLNRSRWTAQEVEVIRDHHWWTVSELQSTEERVWPERLLDMLHEAGVITAGPLTKQSTVR